VREGEPGWDGCLSPRSRVGGEGERFANAFHGSQLGIKGSPAFRGTSLFVCNTLSFRKKSVFSLPGNFKWLLIIYLGENMLFSPLHASRSLMAFSSCPQALGKGLEMWQHFGSCLRNVLLACEKPPSKFCRVTSLRRDKSSRSQALSKAGQLKKSSLALFQSCSSP